MVEPSARAGQLAAVVLAAGAATRFGSPKQNRLLPAVLERVIEVDFDEIVVVEGAHRIEAPLPVGVRLVDCADWELGPGASLECGLAALSADVAAAVIVLADGPRLDPRAIERVIASWRGGAGPALAATYDGARSHPVLLERSSWGAIPASGGRDIGAELVDCRDLTHPGDVDTVADLAGFKEDPER